MISGAYQYPELEKVVFGRPFAQALADEVAAMGANAVFLLAGGSLSRDTSWVSDIRTALGDKLAGIGPRIGPHTPRIDVVAAANQARAAKADLIVTLGGGSITDGAKMVSLCLANNVTDPAELDAYRGVTQPDGTVLRPPVAEPVVRSIFIPITLSAGEFNHNAGCTDTMRGVKESFSHRKLVARTVILDPVVTTNTPDWLFLSTGIRAVDHATEGLCSIAPQPLTDATALHALRLLAPGLARVKANPKDMAARLDCQLGSWLSVSGVPVGVPMGASHGIGHVLGGTAGVPHGYTSCVMLPHVLRFNEPVNAARQAWVAEAVGKPGMSGADAIGGLIAGLGLPTRLRDVEVQQNMLDRIAELSMHDRWVPTNPRRIDSPATVRMLLDQAW